MGFFTGIMEKIFGKDEDEKQEKPAVQPKVETKASDPEYNDIVYVSTAPGERIPGIAMKEVDVETMLDDMEKAHSEDLDWRRSIVDLMKLVDMDSSYAARKEMAIELGYAEKDIEEKGSAEMNMWLHKQVMKRIAANGGIIPSDII